MRLIVFVAGGFLVGCTNEKQFVDVASFSQWEADCVTLCEITANDSIDLISDVCSFKKSTATSLCEGISFIDLWNATSGYNEVDGARELGAGCAAIGAESIIYACNDAVANP